MSDVPGSKRAAGRDEDSAGTPEGGGAGSAPTKRPRTIAEYGGASSSSSGGAEGGGSAASPDDLQGTGPRTIVTFNLNGASPRLAKNWNEIKGFLEEHKPDLVCFQEVRLPAKGVPKAKKEDDTGRKRWQLKDDTAADRKDIALVDRTLRALARRLGYRLVMSLANSKYAGTAALISTWGAVFAITPVTIAFAGRLGLSALDLPEPLGKLFKEHDREGRVIAIEYPSVTVLALYVPNNGSKAESFQRRRRWDDELCGFVDKYSGKLIITGDLNVAHEDADLTHASFFKGMFPAANPEDSGQPGCTPAEKRRHSRLLASGGGLVDAYRRLNPVPAAGAGGARTEMEGMTWRGTAGNQVAAMGRYYGKGMRIDYFLLSTALAPRIKEVKVFGSGADRDGFLGSDHCPLMLTLLP
ncbi:conserved unknown protein [Ectocarpus siliculosus]|uniref:Endonuclease/exonuclease/phosphatase domain-containing protein n=1 Tax=Ectocarpus siliculosus TaxID=2880 RepID=D7FVZ7_ECTSI|nr:conserved unknown protein [Ectocarpus siliculosus]|eukprot:CBJ25517.1 conserved unknown protein [Ectocarpus siliculosus]